MDDELTYTAFARDRRIASGMLRDVLSGTKDELDRGATGVLIFVDQTGQEIDFDFRGSCEEVLDRYAPAKTRTGPGRPKLGVICREVSLLPRHWDWLEKQPQGISAGIRRVVERAMKHEPGKEQARLALEAAGKFMWTMGGDLPDFEEASRALYARNYPRLNALVRDWPADIRTHLELLVERSMRPEDGREPAE